MVSIYICGDIINSEHSDGIICSDSIGTIIQSTDYAVCNFEAPIQGYGTPQPKSGPHHCQLPETINGLKRQGFNCLLLANNHIMDYGRQALEATMHRAHRTGLEYIGAGLNDKEAYEPLTKTINDLRIGMVNASEAHFGVIDFFQKKESAGYAWVNHPRIDKTILHLKKKCDFVIVFSHAGLENYPIPQKEWRNRYKLFCDLGADVVVGSHPHVPQGYEYYEKSLIFYSLGNFYFDTNEYKYKEDQSFSIVLSLKKGSPPIFKPVYHFKSDGILKLSPPEKRINLENLCLMLNDEYESIHEDMSLKAFEQIKRNMTFSLMPVPFDGTIKGSLKRTISRLIGKKKKDDKTLLLLHLIKNEAYYYATRHALEVLSKKNPQKK